MRTALTTLALILLAPTPFLAETDRGIPDNQVAWWTGPWKKALEAASERNVPIVVVVIQDGEEANEALASGVLKDPQFVRALDGCIPIICNKGSHDQVERKTRLGKRHVCSKFGELPCEIHQIHEGHVYRKFFAGKSVKTPQVKFCTPDLEVVQEIIDVSGTPSYLDAIRKVVKKIGPGLDRLQFEAAKVELTRGRNLLKQKKYKEAWDACAKTVAVGGKSKLVKNARAIQETVVGHVEKVMADALSSAEAGDYWSALPPLDLTAVEFKGTDLGKRAKDLLKKLSRTKEGRAVARELRKQKKYLPLLEKARTYEGKADFVKARDTYVRIQQKAKGLPIAKIAEERIAVLMADDDVRPLLEAADREREASNLAREAAKLEKAGRTADAEKLRKRVLDEFPGTRAARRLKK